ncbi:beta-lactoglobulin isoform X2 [Prionailurus iriomotensis]
MNRNNVARNWFLAGVLIAVLRDYVTSSCHSPPHPLGQWEESDDTLHALQTQVGVGRPRPPVGGILGAQGPRPDSRTGQGSCPDERPLEDTYKEGMGAARPLPALGPAVMVPQRGPLLLLALSLGLACAQQTLEEVPVQPGFNAQKVEGRWLTIQLASSRAHLVSPADPLKLGLHSIWTRDEDVTFVLFWTHLQHSAPVALTTVRATPLPALGHRHHGSGLCGPRVCWYPAHPRPPQEERACAKESTSPSTRLGSKASSKAPGEGGNSMHVCFVGTDYSNLVLYARLEDAGEVTSLWALLARTTPGDPTWLGRYLEYVRELRLHKAPVFNLDARCPPAEA